VFIEIWKTHPTTFAFGVSHIPTKFSQQQQRKKIKPVKNNTG